MCGEDMERIRQLEDTVCRLRAQLSEKEYEVMSGTKLDIDNRKCTECGREYKPSGNNQKRCISCRTERAQKGVKRKKKTCLSCGMNYLPTGSCQKICKRCSTPKKRRKK